MEAESSCQKIAGASKKAHSSLIQVSWAEFLTVELVFAKMTEEAVTDHTNGGSSLRAGGREHIKCKIYISCRICVYKVISG